MARRRRVMGTTASAVALAVGAAVVAAPAGAAPADGSGHGRGGDGGGRGRSFERVATFPVFENNADPGAETVAEIVDATHDGKTVVYTDAVQGVVGFVDIRRPSDPRPGGTVDVGGSPTSVSVTNRYALVGVDTSPSFAAPSGHLSVVDLRTHAVVATIDLGGQPDSLKVSPDGRYLAVVMENQRDEEVTVDGVEGGLPQTPPGLLKVVDLRRRQPSGCLPADVVACRAASTNRGSLGAGFEGVTVVPTDGGGYTLAIAQQRGWDYTTPGCEDLDDDPTGANAGEPPQTRVWTYDPATGAWGHVPYELEPVPTDAAWVGLSEIVALDDGTFGLIERDNLTGDYSQLKWLTRVDLSAPVTRGDKGVHDLLPDLRATNGWITDKPEGFTVAADGRAYIVTDNDGVEDWTGETQLLDLGRIRRLFG